MPKKWFPHQSNFIHFLLAVITLTGGFFRFYNLNWDQGHFFHPDERNIAMAVARIRFFDHLNPEFFAYGSLPVYLYRLIGEILIKITGNPDWLFSWGKINLIGRSVSAFLSTITILLIFLTVKKIFNREMAILAAFLTAFNPSLIQTAHFGVTESMLLFWLFLLLLFSLKTIEKPTVKNYFKIGLILGFSWATKISSLSFLILPITSHFLNYFRHWKHYLLFIFSIFVGLVTFVGLSPYVFLDKEKFMESMIYESGVVTGKLKVVYVLQFEKTLPYLFQIKNFFWQMGPVAAIGLVGIFLLLVWGSKKKNKNILLFLVFPLTYFFYVGSWFTKFIRYMTPVLPFLGVAASWLLWQIKIRRRRLGLSLIFLFMTINFVWTLAFFSIYTREQTRITASRFIYQNLPKNSKVLTEHWDDGLPLPLKEGSPNFYQGEQLTIYEPDNLGKIDYYATKLSQADYLIINSRRLYGTLMFLPEKYPLTSRYYQLLFAGNLGYQKIAEFSSYPSLFGITINDDSSEETFQVYDHPKVIIFQNKERLSKNSLSQRMKKN